MMSWCDPVITGVIVDVKHLSATFKARYTTQPSVLQHADLYRHPQHGLWEPGHAHEPEEATQRIKRKKTVVFCSIPGDVAGVC